MAAKRWQISVDQHVCVSSGNCVGIAPGWFELTRDGARPTAERIDEDEDVVDAAETCPMGAITVIDVSDDSVVAP